MLLVGWICALCQVGSSCCRTHTEPECPDHYIHCFSCGTCGTTQKSVPHFFRSNSFRSLKNYFARNIFLIRPYSKELELCFPTVPKSCSGKIGARRTSQIRTHSGSQNWTKIAPKSEGSSNLTGSSGFPLCTTSNTALQIAPGRCLLIKDKVREQTQTFFMFLSR